MRLAKRYRLVYITCHRYRSVSTRIVSGAEPAAAVGHSSIEEGEFVMKPIVTLRHLKRSLVAASIVAVVAGSAAMAQAQSLAMNQSTPPPSDAMRMAEWNGRSVARTGATVANPGTAKIGPETETERRAQQRSDRAIRTICIGCL
jgi:hypothetical protein